MNSNNEEKTYIEISGGINDCILMNIVSDSTLDKLSKVLAFAQERENKPLTLIITDLCDEDDNRSNLYANMARVLRSHRVKRIISIGSDLAVYSVFFSTINITRFADVNSLLNSLGYMEFRNEAILMFGKGLHDVTERLEERHNETSLKVSLDNIIANYRFYHQFLKSETKVVAMVKAQSYGAGAVEVSKTLKTIGVSYLAVAGTDEGSELRRAGVDLPILVLNPRIPKFRELFAGSLEPEIFSLELCQAIINEANKRGIKNFPVHIKIDTGMHRLGFLKEQLPELLDLLKGQDAITPRSVFAHLAVADSINEQMDAYTLKQFAYFDECVAMIKQEFPKVICHHLNTAGIIRFSDHQYDMVRLGIGLYGTPILPDGSDSSIKQVSSLHTRIIAIKDWSANDTIGYGRRGVLDRDSRIATIPIGYADGLDRHLSNRRYSVWVNGVRCPIVGNICMDACMVDITDAPTETTVGTDVEIFGEHISVNEMAETLDTIPYEVLTSVAPRVKRIYTIHI